MDRQFRDIQRDYQVDSSTENFIRVLRALLRMGENIELTHELVNHHWDDPKLRNFLAALPKTRLRVCDYELVRPLVTRTFLLGQVRHHIAQEFNFLHDVQEIAGARSAYGGEFNIMHTAFSPNGEGAGRFFVVTLFNDGYAEHLVDFECNWDWSQWEVTTKFVNYWEAMGYCSYNEICDIDTCNDDHIGTEDHVNEIDAIRADEVEGHFNIRLREEPYNEFINLGLQGY